MSNVAGKSRWRDHNEENEVEEQPDAHGDQGERGARHLRKRPTEASSASDATIDARASAHKKDEPRLALDGVKAESGPNNNGDSSTPPSSARWSALRQRLRDSAARKGRGNTDRNKARIAGQMSVVTELQTGILPVFMLKMSLERDEQGHRRIPILLSHLRFRISDSVNPLHTSSAVFRIELEYGDGLIRWVCYRSLRDFINLHTHYRAGAIKGYLGRSVGANEGGDVGLPSFPKTSLPYFNQLQRQGWGKNGENVKARFAQIQRTSLEDYLLELIKRTMLRPEANRLCKFLELSALSISLAARGGYQGKQGYLRILSRSSRKDAQRGGLLAPLSWARMHEPKWFIVRESYIVVVEQPDSLEVFDVILIDNAFEIVRPKRLYRQTLNLAHDISHSDKLRGGKDNNDQSKEAGSNEESTTASNTSANKGKEKAGATHDSHSQERQNDKPLYSSAVKGNDQTAILTEGHFRDAHDDEYSGSLRKKSEANVSNHTFYVRNSERKLKFVANNERQMNQFIASMERVARRSIFSKANRFGSFAPIRLHCHAQWLVDGRDYFWQVSRAISRAKQRICIHDWWLSPELYLRRPGVPKWRLDNLLKRKAEEGVEIFVILYNEVSNNFTPTDSNYTKQRLIGLHHNIHVQRSPSHFQTGTFYWAHHEKMCVIDETIAFMGGIDLCFGRWDTSEHVLTDRDVSAEAAKSHNADMNANEASRKMQNPEVGSSPSVASSHSMPATSQANASQRRSNLASVQRDKAVQGTSAFLGPSTGKSELYVWPGQDYANERVIEWYDLTKPEVDLFDRNHYPRMPWHDVGLQIIGQPARDLCRHFTQRWNHLLRIKNHKRHMPFLIPPPDFHASELQKFGLTGTCEVQICRSAGPWSMGTPSTVEHSIQNAYLKAIQLSKHFVYIENQFFVTSTEARGTVVENQIGEALVSRIIRAEREQTPWKAVVVIPLIPGFPMPIDHPEASSVRLIVDLQYRSICRGEESIFGKLRRRGIDPAQYIDFFSLRQWGKLPSGRLTTEQVYIHGKAMIVDDRLALIGSANINERSQRGDRDSELACVVRDTDMIPSTMAGKPFKVGRFAHTLRVRLMREHLGVDVDVLAEQDREENAGDEGTEQEEGKSPPPSSTSNADLGSYADQEARASLNSKNESAEEVHEQTSTNRGGRGGRLNGFSDTAKDTLKPMGKGAKHETKDGIQGTLDRVRGYDDPARGSVADAEWAQTLAKERDQSASVAPTGALPEQKQDHLEKGDQAATSAENASLAAPIVPTMEERIMSEVEKGEIGDTEKASSFNDAGTADREYTQHESADTRHDYPKESNALRMSNNPWAPPLQSPSIDANMFIDPLDDQFYRQMWMASAVHNTQIYRKVFRSVPDDTVTTWQEYKAFHAWNERLSRSGGNSDYQASPPPPPTPGPAREGRQSQTDSSAASMSSSSSSRLTPTDAEGRESATKTNSLIQEAEKRNGFATANPSVEHAKAHADIHSRPITTGSALSSSQPIPQGLAARQEGASTKITTNAGAVDEGFSQRDLSQMEALLQETRGTLVLFSTRFLEAEDRSDNFLFPMDKINPLNVYS